MADDFNSFDHFAMARALELAARGLATTQPNPRVGCVIACDGRIVGEGWHERAGGAHAEIMALEEAGAASVGATAYVTLEPCNHFGRTPPCAEALVRARIGRVVFALEDPNPKVGGTGAQRLCKAGIEVRSGLLAREAEVLNSGYLSRMRRGRPWIRVKLAMSLDGRTALVNGASRWITGPAARADVQQWRARSCVVLTGIGTVLADDPRLDVRLATAERQPLRVVLDSRLRTPPTARVFDGLGGALLFTASDDAGRRNALQHRGARIEWLAGSPLDLAKVLLRLGELGMNEVLVEAGPTLAGEFIRTELVDELLLYVAPLLLGPQARALVELPQITQLEAARRFTLIETRTLDSDLRLLLRAA